MSCHVVYLKDGVKYLRPVLNREEYLQLRDSRSQHILVDAVRRGETDKKHLLLQMNYSCLPNEDGTLKGSTRMSTSVGMDIDHIEPEKMEEVMQCILSKAQELGLLLLEKSVRGLGYHLVFKRRPELSQEENLKWASELLVVDYDQGAKDITRIFYTTTESKEDLIYLDDELFKIEEVEEVKRDITTQDSKLLSLNSQLEYKGIPYAEIIDKWWQQNGGAPEIGERNVKLHKLAVHLRGICDNDKALLLKIMPRFGLSESEIQSIVESACQEQPKAITKAMKQVLSPQDEELNYYEQLTEGYNPPPMPKRLPRLHYLCLKPFSKEYHSVLAPSTSVILAPHASHFRTTYIDGRVVGPGLYESLAAPSGANKSFVAILMDMMTKYTLQDSDAKEWQKVRENQELRDKMANAKEKPARYRPKLRIAETMSKTSLLDLQTNLGDNGMLLCMFSEADALVNASKALFSNISVLLRKAFDGDVVRQYYLSESSCSTQTRLNASVLLTGTPKAVLGRLFSDTEDGMMQRFMPLLMPRQKRTFLPPSITPLTPDEQAERDALLLSLWQKDLALGDETCLLEMPKTQKVVKEFYQKMEERYNDGELTEAEADLSHRVGQFMMRAAIPYVALYGEEHKEMLEYIKWLGEYVYYNICYLFASRVSQDMKTSAQLLQREDKRVTAQPLLSLMPEVFTTQQFKEERLRRGQSGEVRMLLSRYCKSGKLQRLENGVFRKTG